MKTLIKIFILITASLVIWGCEDEERKSQISFTFDSTFTVLNKQLDCYLEHRSRTDSTKYDAIVIYGKAASDTSENMTIELTDSTSTFVNGYTGVMTINLLYCQSSRCFESVYKEFNCTVNSYGGVDGFIEGRFDGYLSAVTSSSSGVEGTSSEGTVKSLMQDGVFYLRIGADRTSY